MGIGLDAESAPVAELPDETPAFGAHLGGVRSVMLVAWHVEEGRFVTVPLRICERTRLGQLVFSLPNPEWLAAFGSEYETICLTAQVEDRFVCVQGTVALVEDPPPLRVMVEPVNQTFWDSVSGRVAHVTADAFEQRIVAQSMALDKSPYKG